MKVMVLVKANKDSEAGVMPGEELLTAMTEYNEALVQAGVLQAGDGLHPSARGKRVLFQGERPTVVDGPFAETKELVAGYWLWQVKDMDEAVAWARRCPFPAGGDAALELRPVFEPEDFGEALTPELREREERIAQQEAANKRKP